MKDQGCTLAYGNTLDMKTSFRPAIWYSISCMAAKGLDHDDLNAIGEYYVPLRIHANQGRRVHRLYDLQAKSSV